MQLLLLLILLDAVLCVNGLLNCWIAEYIAALREWIGCDRNDDFTFSIDVTQSLGSYIISGRTFWRLFA
jgi:hypothetical protein